MAHQNGNMAILPYVARVIRPLIIWMALAVHVTLLVKQHVSRLVHVPSLR